MRTTDTKPQPARVRLTRTLRGCVADGLRGGAAFPVYEASDNGAVWVELKNRRFAELLPGEFETVKD